MDACTGRLTLIRADIEALKAVPMQRDGESQQVKTRREYLGAEDGASEQKAMPPSSRQPIITKPPSQRHAHFTHVLRK